MTPVTIAQLRAAPTIDLMTAARALGLGRTKAYDLPGDGVGGGNDVISGLDPDGAAAPSVRRLVESQRQE
jgi:hypothetical protein